MRWNHDDAEQQGLDDGQADGAMGWPYEPMPTADKKLKSAYEAAYQRGYESGRDNARPHVYTDALPDRAARIAGGCFGFDGGPQTGQAGPLGAEVIAPSRLAASRLVTALKEAGYQAYWEMGP